MSVAQHNAAASATPSIETKRLLSARGGHAAAPLSASFCIDAMEEHQERQEQLNRSPMASSPPPTPSSSWISLSDVGSFPSAYPKLATSASSTSLSGAMDMAAYAPQLYAPHPESPSMSPFGGMNDAANMEDRARRFSMSSTSGVTLEDDIRSIGDQMKRVLAFCELQSQNPIRLQAKINDLQEQLQLTIAEKNYWMKRCKEMSSQSSAKSEFKNEFSIKESDEEAAAGDLQYAKKNLRRRTNSELILIADTWGSPGEGIYNEETASSADSDSSSSSETISMARSPFRLLQCSDEQCEVFTPMNRSIRTQHRSRNNVQFMWDEPPKSVLIIKKPNDNDVTQTLIRFTSWLNKEKNLSVYLEPIVYKELALPNTKTWDSNEDWEECQTNIDFVVSLGGDGTVLWVSSLFKKSVPPVISFAMGSLGFLTPFETDSYVEHLTSVINGGFYMSLRSRLVGTIIRKNKEVEPLPSLHALNEIVIDRGPFAALVELNCYCDGLEITKIAADGIIIATPTGSTAYSLSAGGSMTHPSVPTMLFTPICPHTLSFRPLLFHDSATLKIEFPMSSRATSAYVSFDGKNRVQLERGDCITVRVSSFPVPSICRVNENQDWFESMITNLNWNQRRAQKPWAVPS